MQSDTSTTPIDPSNLSPALAAMVGMLVMPAQYARIIRASVASVNEQCPLTIRRIMK